MTTYYNENDPFAAEWLRQLILSGMIPNGYVDERSIEDVLPSDLDGFTQHHFFAGIGGWAYALRQAGWNDDRPIWTASCPCQPFSQAGKGGGFDDKRHLWPDLYWLIEQHKPQLVIGEQVASKDGLAWLDTVQADLEKSNYASGAVDSCAAGFGAPHIRQRLYWMAHADDAGLEGRTGMSKRPDQFAAWSGRLVGGLDDTDLPSQHERSSSGKQSLCIERNRLFPASAAGPTNGFWRDADWLFCRDGKWRAVEPGTFPLANGVPARMGALRGYGNAINIEQAKAFIEAVMELI